MMGTGFDITNEDRAELGLIAVRAFAAATRQDNGAPPTQRELRDTSEGWMAREIVGDLMCDLIHLLGKDAFDMALDAGRAHYEAEVCQFCANTSEDYGVCDDCAPIRCSRCGGLIAAKPLCDDGETHQSYTGDEEVAS